MATKRANVKHPARGEPDGAKETGKADAENLSRPQLNGNLSKVATRLLNLFAGLDRAHGSYTVSGPRNGKGKQEGEALTIKKPATLKHWEQHLRGDYGLGVIPIRDDGTCRFGAIDIDVYDGLDHAAIERKIKELGLPLLLTLTKSGGAHLWLFCSEDVSAELVQERLMEWADLLGFEGPEIFPKQSRLAGKNDWGNWINMPYQGGDATVRYALRDGQRIGPEEFAADATAAAVTAEMLAAFPSCSPGTTPEPSSPLKKQDTGEVVLRNNTLTHHGGWLRRNNCSNEVIEAVLHTLNQELFDTPLSDKEVRQIAKNVAKYEPEPSADSSPLLRRLADLLADPNLLKPPTPVAPRFAWRGRSTLLASREKAGKTTLASFIAAQVSSGSPLFNEATIENGAAVLWVILEGHLSETAYRLVNFGGQTDAIYILDRLPKGLDTLTSAVLESKPALIVVDTLSSLVEGVISDHSNDAAGWTKVMNGLGRIARDADAGLIVLHHARKTDGKYRDSSAIGAGVDMILEMFEVENDPTLRLFKPRGRWTVDPFGVRFDEIAMSYALSTGELPLETRVLDFIRRTPGCSQNALRKAITGKREAVDAAVAALIRRELVKDDTRGGGHAYTAKGLSGRPGLESWTDSGSERYEEM